MDIKFLSSKRPIIEAELNGKKYAFLLDTGASVGIIDNRLKGLHPSSRKIPIIDASGDSIKCPILNDYIILGGKKLTQFLSSDIGGVRQSIGNETGYDIRGIISYAQMKSINAVMDIAGNKLIMK